MDIQARKYNLIEYLIELRDETILTKIEMAISSTKNNKSQLDIKSLTEEQLIKRAEKSSDDYTAGRFKTQEQLEKESANW